MRTVLFQTLNRTLTMYPISRDNDRLIMTKLTEDSLPFIVFNQNFQTIKSKLKS
jgi:hypothetical protein